MLLRTSSDLATFLYVLRPTRKDIPLYLRSTPDLRRLHHTPLLLFYGTSQRQPHVRNFHQSPTSTASDKLRPLTEDSQYFSREEMISLLAAWMRNPPYFGIRANTSDSPRHSALSCNFRSPLRPSRNQSAHVRKHRLVIGTVRQDYTRGATRCRTRPGLSGTVSERRYTIYGNRRFICDVVRPLFRTFLYKNFSFVYGIFSSPMLP